MSSQIPVSKLNLPSTGKNSRSKSLPSSSKGDAADSTLNAATTSKQIFSSSFEIIGKVQGVYFRKHTQIQAKKLGVYGWVMNTDQGTVKGVIEAPLSELTDMKFWLQNKGSPRSIIQRATFTPSEPIPNYNFKTFAIRR